MISLFAQWKTCLYIYRNKSVKLLLSLKHDERYLCRGTLSVLSFPPFFHKRHVGVQWSVVCPTQWVWSSLWAWSAPARERGFRGGLCILTPPRGAQAAAQRPSDGRLSNGFSCLQLNWVWESRQCAGFTSCSGAFLQEGRCGWKQLSAAPLTGVMYRCSLTLPHKSKTALLLQASVFLWICFSLDICILWMPLLSLLPEFPPQYPLSISFTFAGFFFFAPTSSVFVKIQYEWICH